MKPSSLKLAGWIYAALVYGFLYLPLAVVALFSFSASPTVALPIPGLTLDWYRVLAARDDLWSALGASLLVSAGAVGASLVLGVCGAMLLYRYRFPGQGLFRAALVLPVVLPGVLMGFSLAVFLRLLGLEASLLNVALGHVTFITPIVVFLVHARLERLDPNLAAAAQDLGATPLGAFWHVTLPAARTAILGAALLGFTLSFDEAVMTVFLVGSEPTLPYKIWTLLRFRYGPDVNALCAIVLAASAALIGASALLVRPAQR